MKLNELAGMGLIVIGLLLFVVTVGVISLI
jgi:hypothetical protein